MMKIRTRWAWFALACGAVLLAAWMARYEYHCYAARGCYAVNRVTGEYHVARRTQPMPE